MRILVVTLEVYSAASSSTVVQDLHTALGWVACTEVHRGFCTRVLYKFMQIYIWNVQEELDLQEVIHNYINFSVCMASQSYLCITLFVRPISLPLYMQACFIVTNEKLWGQKKEFLACSKHAWP